MRLFLFAIPLLAAGLASAQDVGRVHFISGESDVERAGRKTPLQVFSQVREGDVIHTGADGHVQLVMVDGARIGVRPKSQLRLERYQFTPSSRGAGQALLALVTGTIRVFTGEIVERDRNNFTMKTNLANIGIRGSGNILANLEGGATFNHTLTGAHSVTSRDALGVERTVVSYPGQTVQVLPGQAPRQVPTPALIMAAASTPAAARASDKASESAQASAAGGTAAASSGTASSTTTTAGSGSTATEPSSTTSSTTATATTPSTGGDAPPTTALAGTTTTTTTTTTSGTSTIGSTSPSIATSQAGTGTIGSSIGTSQPPAASGYELVFRFFNPLAAGGYEGVIGSIGSGGAGVVFDASGRLVQVRGASVDTFLAGPGALPAGYSEATLLGDVAFTGGTHRDAFRSSDGSVILGRWEGGTVGVSGSSTRSFDLGARSVSYEVVTPTSAGVVGSFTGSANYSLVAATTPTDAAGHAGTVGSATVAANFSARTVSGNFALAINGQAFSLSGTAGLTPGSSSFSFASALQNLSIGCTGTCATAGYLGTLNGQFAGAAARWLTVSYRLNPARAPGSAFSDFVIGNIALEAGTGPTIGIVLPQTGTANLVFNGVDASQSFSTYAGATGTPTVTGTLQANFTNRTVAFNATVSGASNPTVTLSSASAPITGAGFAASTDPQRGPGVGALSVTCAGSGCGSSPSGRFDGLFRNSAGTTGIASFVAGDSNGAFDVVTSFGTTLSAAQLVAADARSAARALPAVARLPVSAFDFRAPSRVRTP